MVRELLLVGVDCMTRASLRAASRPLASGRFGGHAGPGHGSTFVSRSLTRPPCGLRAAPCSAVQRLCFTVVGHLCSSTPRRSAIWLMSQCPRHAHFVSRTRDVIVLVTRLPEFVLLGFFKHCHAPHRPQAGFVYMWMCSFQPAGPRACRTADGRYADARSGHPCIFQECPVRLQFFMKLLLLLDELHQPGSIC